MEPCGLGVCRSHTMSSTQATETKTSAQTTNDTSQTDVSAVRASVETAAEILEANDEPVRIGRLVGTAFRVGSREKHRLETYVRVAREYLEKNGYDTDVVISRGER